MLVRSGGRRRRRRLSQWKEILARTNPNIIPGAVHTMILRLPIMSMYFKAKSVKRKFVPAIISPTAVGWLNPMDLKRVAE